MLIVDTHNDALLELQRLLEGAGFRVQVKEGLDV